jgi:hypothetical protein
VYNIKCSKKLEAGAAQTAQEIEMFKEADAIELALNYAGLDQPRDLKVTQFEDGSFKVELTSDITVFVDADGNCNYPER